MSVEMVSENLMNQHLSIRRLQRNRWTAAATISCLTLLTFVAATTASPPGLVRCSAEECGLNAARLAAIDDVIEEGLRYDRMPGCVVLVGYRNRIAWAEELTAHDSSNQTSFQ